MRKQISFREARSLHIPAVGLHRNVVFEQIAGLGAPVEAPSPLRLVRLQPPVHLPRTDLQQLPLDLRPQAIRLRIQGIHSGNNAFKRTDQGYPAASHTAVNAATVSWQ